MMSSDRHCMFSGEDKIQLSRSTDVSESCLSSQFGNRPAEKEKKKNNKKKSDHEVGIEL